MLLKVGDRVRVAPEVDLIVLAVNKGKARLGFMAPDWVRIERGERIEIPIQPGVFYAHFTKTAPGESPESLEWGSQEGAD